jgi:hypothetical protein
VVSRPVAGLDKVDCRILKRLNDGSEAPGPTVRSRINKLVKFGFVEEKSFGEFGITMRGQLELARWRFRNLPKSRYAISGPLPGGNMLEKIFKAAQSS